MIDTPTPSSPACDEASAPPEVEVVIEIPRGSFLKRGSTGRIDFVSPFPCPFNYGSVPTHLGLEGDLLDALVLGPRLPTGTRIRVRAWGAVTLADRGMEDDKLVCSLSPPSAAEKAFVLRFFRFYALCKGLLMSCAAVPGATRARAGAPRRRPLPGPSRGRSHGRRRRSNTDRVCLSREEKPSRGDPVRRPEFTRHCARAVADPRLVCRR